MLSLKDSLPHDFPYVITESNYSSPENFSCTLRVKLKNEEDFNTFLNKFETITNTNWIFRQSKSESRKFLFSREYVCHHANYHKKGRDIELTGRSGADTEKNDRMVLNVTRGRGFEPYYGNNDNTATCNKNKNCTAKLSVRIKHNTKRVRYKDKLVKEGYMSIIKILFVHTHVIDSEESMHWLKRAPETRDMFIEYFNKGMSPAEAINYHKNKIISEEPQSIANCRKNPPQRWVYKLRNKWLKENLEGLKGGKRSLIFPKNGKRRLLHETQHKRKNLKERFKASISSKVCSKHFEEKCFNHLEENGSEKNCLKEIEKDALDEVSTFQVEEDVSAAVSNPDSILNLHRKERSYVTSEYVIEDEICIIEEVDEDEDSLLSSKSGNLGEKNPNGNHNQPLQDRLKYFIFGSNETSKVVNPVVSKQTACVTHEEALRSAEILLQYMMNQDMTIGDDVNFIMNCIKTIKENIAKERTTFSDNLEISDSPK